MGDVCVEGVRVYVGVHVGVYVGDTHRPPALGVLASAAAFPPFPKQRCERIEQFEMGIVGKCAIDGGK